MGNVDVQRAFHSMTLPPPKSGEHEWRAAITREEGDRVGIPVVGDRTPYECPDVEFLSQEEQDAQIREAVTCLVTILGTGPQPLQLVLDLLGCRFDLEQSCTLGLFWRVQERGYLSLRQGLVYLGRLETRR
jgi:hypothetical protein